MQRSIQVMLLKLSTQKILRSSVVLHTLLAVSTLVPVQVSASPIISEIYPSPPTGESEWIELYNPDTTAADLSGLQLFDVLSTPSHITTLTAGEQLEPGQYRQVIVPAAKLNNSGDGVTLKKADGTILDELNFGSTPTATSWQRTTLTASDLIAVSAPTPGAAHQSYPLAPAATPVASPTSTPAGTAPPSPSPSPTPATTASPVPIASPTASSTPSPTPLITEPSPASSTDLTALKLSEIMACPTTGEAEWIELFSSSASPIELKNWIVQDASGNKKYLTGTLTANGFTQLSWTGSLLNNSGDSITLMSTEGQPFITTAFTDCETGHSLVYAAVSASQSSVYDWLPASPTPGKKNQLSSPVLSSQMGTITPLVTVPALETVHTFQSDLHPDHTSKDTGAAPSERAASSASTDLWKNYSFENLTTTLQEGYGTHALATTGASPAAPPSTQVGQITAISSRHAILAGILLLISSVSTTAYVYPTTFASILTKIPTILHTIASH